MGREDLLHRRFDARRADGCTIGWRKWNERDIREIRGCKYGSCYTSLDPERIVLPRNRPSLQGTVDWGQEVCDGRNYAAVPENSHFNTCDDRVGTPAFTRLSEGASIGQELKSGSGRAFAKRHSI